MKHLWTDIRKAHETRAKKADKKGAAAACRAADDPPEGHEGNGKYQAADDAEIYGGPGGFGE